MKNLFKSVCLLTLILNTTNSFAHDAKLPDEHAPIGVMGDHNHKQGEWMTSYRYSSMKMKGNRKGTDSVSKETVLSQFMVAPLEMTMEMHMFGLMYGATDDLTLMAMAPYTLKSMDHENRMGVKFETEAEGLGDIKLSGLYKLYDSGNDQDIHRSRHKLMLNLGLSLPTGSIDERGDTPAGLNQKLPYPMQLGSGTFDPIFGLTYLNRFENWSWGAQTNTTVRLGKNEEGYRLGNEYGATTWVARNLNKYASISFRLDGKSTRKIHGQDQDLTPGMVPTARPDLIGGERVDALIGLNLYKGDGTLAGNRLAAEFGRPIYQNLNGPQLETDYRFTLGWQWAF